MAFIPHTQEQLKTMKLSSDKTYTIEYCNKDYYNGEETIEKGSATAIFSGDNIYFSVVDPYGMEKMVMQVRVLGVED